ncbi:MAG TPA: sigma-70 family RNA polymerase sigma factor [Solirubrobacteraceae bacterium]|jgi:RNA polymerase sigma-70 factor (ECF subfamily)
MDRSPSRAAAFLARAVARQQTLDDAAIEQLFRDCAHDLHAYAISLLRDRAAAEDVTALAFERLYRARARLDPDRGSPRTWLFTIARNAALDELRRRGRTPQALVEPDPIDDASTAALEDVERRATLREALASLELRERELILLKFHGQLSNAELGRTLGISESNAGTRLHRALARLRERSQTLDRQEVA